METQDKNTTKTVYDNVITSFISRLERMKEHNDSIADKYYPEGKPLKEFIQIGRSKAIKDMFAEFSKILNEAI